jgi:hypothetical protein
VAARVPACVGPSDAMRQQRAARPVPSAPAPRGPPGSGVGAAAIASPEAARWPQTGVAAGAAGGAGSADGFLPKPFDPDLLAAEVAHLLTPAA